MKNNLILTGALFLVLYGSHAGYADASHGAPGTFSVIAAKHGKEPRIVGERFARTELYFGTARSDNHPPVSEAEFQDFLDTKIIPAFPDGLTLLKGMGQFRGATVQVEYLACAVSGDLADTVAIERSEVRLVDQNKPAAMALHVTHIFRKEDGAWKLVLRHADPLMGKAAPATVLQK